MTRRPNGDDPPIEGGGAAERLRQFLAARSEGDIDESTEAQRAEDTDAAPGDEEASDDPCTE